MFCVLRLHDLGVELAMNSDRAWCTPDHAEATVRAENVGGVVIWGATMNAVYAALRDRRLVLGKKPGTRDALITLPVPR